MSKTICLLISTSVLISFFMYASGIESAEAFIGVNGLLKTFELKKIFL